MLLSRCIKRRSFVDVSVSLLLWFSPSAVHSSSCSLHASVQDFMFAMAHLDCLCLGSVIHFRALKVNALVLAVVACCAAAVLAVAVAVFLFPNDLWKISSANIILSVAVAQFASRRIFIEAASAVANILPC